MTTNTTKPAELFADSSRGIYIPQHFAETADRSKWAYIEESDWKILESGPDHESYLDAWDCVLNNAETTCGGVLHQDGDLWIVWPNQAIQAINDLCDDMLDYETTHTDAGNNYAHMPTESWGDHKTRDLVENLNEEKRDHSVTDHFAPDSYKPQSELLGIDKRWKDIEPDILADMAIETFDMVPGSIYGPYGNDCIVLDSFPVGEIEVSLEHLGIDAITLDLIRESCDAYISGNDYAYIATDAVWFAVVDVEALNIEIEQYIDSMGS